MKLGVLAGIDETTASGRINQYERGKHAPDLLTAKHIASALEVPLAYLFCEEDELAALIEVWHAMGKLKRRTMLKSLLDETGR